jgi:hypothetical protein
MSDEFIEPLLPVEWEKLIKTKEYAEHTAAKNEAKRCIRAMCILLIKYHRSATFEDLMVKMNRYLSRICEDVRDDLIRDIRQHEMLKDEE